MALRRVVEGQKTAWRPRVGRCWAFIGQFVEAVNRWFSLTAGLELGVLENRSRFCLRRFLVREARGGMRRERARRLAGLRLGLGFVGHAKRRHFLHPLARRWWWCRGRRHGARQYCPQRGAAAVCGALVTSVRQRGPWRRWWRRQGAKIVQAAGLPVAHQPGARSGAFPAPPRSLPHAKAGLTQRDGGAVSSRRQAMPGRRLASSGRRCGLELLGGVRALAGGLEGRRIRRVRTPPGVTCPHDRGGGHLRQYLSPSLHRGTPRLGRQLVDLPAPAAQQPGNGVLNKLIKRPLPLRGGGGNALLLR